MLLALPGGVLADSFDRRWLLFTVQVYFFVTGLVLAGLAAAGHLPPALLLTFTVALGAGVAVQLPTWQSTVPELVSRAEIRAASRLDLVSVNVSRAVGPALAGVVIAHLGGVPVVFALYACSVVFLAVALLRWRREPAQHESTRERFVPALRAGSRYVWHEPVVRRIMLRLVLFVLPGVALWALLPVIASQRLGLSADGFGALFAALGTGAIVGALVLGRVKGRLSVNAMLAVGGLLYAAALAGLVTVASFPAALVILVVSGLAWMVMTSTLQAEMQLILPAWVRARGLALYTVVFMGCQTVGALLWGLVANQAGLRPGVLVAAGGVLLGALVGLALRVPDTGKLDPQAVVYWPDAEVAAEPSANAGPVLVTVRFTVTPDREPEFLEAMDQLRRSRLRTGATRWELYRDAERPSEFVETFRVPSWEEHLRQHAGRLTAADQVVEERALGFSDPPVAAQHLVPP
jgi:predicted MFS family arabinose efflux permease